MKFLRFHSCFFIIALIVFVVEVLIALFVRDKFIRPYLGDVIVIWFVYYFILKNTSRFASVSSGKV